MCQCLDVVATRLRRSPSTWGLGWGPTLCPSPQIENPTSATDSSIRVELYAPQTPTDTVSHHPHLGLWPRRTMADGFSGHAKTQSVEQRPQIFVNGHRRLVQVCLGRPHQIKECRRHDPRVGSDTPTGLTTTTPPCTNGSRPRIFESKGPSLVQETQLASFLHVWG